MHTITNNQIDKEVKEVLTILSQEKMGNKDLLIFQIIYLNEEFILILYLAEEVILNMEKDAIGIEAENKEYYLEQEEETLYMDAKGEIEIS